MKDAERSLRFYTETLGFSLEWNYQEQGRTFVFEVSLFGFQLILNQTEPGTEDRAGNGRLFIGLDVLFFWLPESERASLQAHLAGAQQNAAS